MRLAGPALPVHSPGGDNLWLHRALEAARPGDVMGPIHVSAPSSTTRLLGRGHVTTAKSRGLAGLVIDGCVRGGDLLDLVGVPVFARGLSIRGTGKDFGALGWVGYPILLGDVVVQPGDLIVGDGDELVALPRAPRYRRCWPRPRRAERPSRDESAVLQPADHDGIFEAASLIAAECNLRPVGAVFRPR